MPSEHDHEQAKRVLDCFHADPPADSKFLHTMAAMLESALARIEHLERPPEDAEVFQLRKWHEATAKKYDTRSETRQWHLKTIDTIDTIQRQAIALEAVRKIGWCDGAEQEAFEAWAKSQRYDMTEHPLHWLFLDEKTYAARNGWGQAMAYVSKRVAAILTAPAETRATGAQTGDTDAALRPGQRHPSCWE